MSGSHGTCGFEVCFSPSVEQKPAGVGGSVMQEKSRTQKLTHSSDRPCLLARRVKTRQRRPSDSYVFSVRGHDSTDFVLDPDINDWLGMRGEEAVMQDSVMQDCI